MLDRWSSYTVMIVWEFAGVDSAMVVLDKWSSCGCLSRFDWTQQSINNSFILCECNTKNVPKLNRRQCDFRADRKKPKRKSVENPPGRLLFPEKHLKQTKLPSGKKRNCGVCSDLKKRLKGP